MVVCSTASVISWFSEKGCIWFCTKVGTVIVGDAPSDFGRFGGAGCFSSEKENDCELDNNDEVRDAKNGHRKKLVPRLSS